MQGMNALTGKAISDTDHLWQSVGIILRTPKGSRVMLPDFGSDLIDYIGVQITPSNKTRIYAATIDALAKWEPRLTIEQVQVTSEDEKGILNIEIKGIYNEIPVAQTIPIGNIVTRQVNFMSDGSGNWYGDGHGNYYSTGA